MNHDVVERDNPAEESRDLAPRLDQETSLVVQIAQAELNQAVTTARAFPRSVARSMQNITSLATLDAVTAQECIYALPRAGKAIRGPSVRFAEIIASQWGNCHVGARVVAVDKADKVVIAEGVFHDLETGFKRIHQVRRRVTDKKGNLLSDDMLTVIGNAACSIAMREAVLKGVPKGVWRRAYEACDRVLAGDIKTLAQRRDEAMKAMAAFGVNAEQVCAYLEIGGLADITLDHLATLVSVYTAIKKGEQTVEDYFDPNLKTAALRKPAASAQATVKAETAPKAGQAEAKTEAGEPESQDPKSGPREEVKPADGRWASLYDAVIQDALDAGNIDAPLAAHAAAMDLMQKEDPDLYRKLMAELDAWATGGDEQGGLKV